MIVLSVRVLGAETSEGQSFIGARRVELHNCLLARDPNVRQLLSFVQL